MKKIYLSSPHMGDLEQRFVQEAFDTNWIAPLGANVDAFEKELANKVGIRAAVALNSGTSAIHLALKLLNVGTGDVVFVSTLTFVASANPILYQGAEPVFIDSETESWNMSPVALQKALKAHEVMRKLPKAIIVVNLYGQSADMDSIMKVAGQYDIPVIEDAAESLGASYKNKASGTVGHFGIYSFNGNKIITTSGGGMLVSNDDKAIEKARFWATQARDQARHYQHSEIGFNYRMSNVLAGIGRGQLAVLDDRVRARRAVFNKYVELLSDIKGISFMPEMDQGTSSRWLTAITIDPTIIGVTTHNIIDELEYRNIEARPVWKPMHLQPLFASSPYYPHEDHSSISDGLFYSGICLPSGSNLSEEDIESVAGAIREAVRKRRLE